MDFEILLAGTVNVDCYWNARDLKKEL